MAGNMRVAERRTLPGDRSVGTPVRIPQKDGPYDLNGRPVGAVVADGDYGDVVVSDEGGAWGIDPALLTPFGRSLTASLDAGAARSVLLAQAASLILDALAGMGTATGLVEQTGPAAFAKRALGVGAATSILTRGDGDGRYALASALAGYAPLDSPAFTGTPTAPTATVGNSSTRIATTAFVSTAIANLINLAPGALDTLDELAQALGDDPNFAGTVTTALAGKLAAASNLSDLANVATARTNLGLVIGTHVQAFDADLAAIAALATTTFGRSLLTLADKAALRAAGRSAACAVKLADQTGVALNAGLYVLWDGETVDDDGWHSTAADTSRLTVPAGVTRVRVGATVRLANSTAAAAHTMTILKNRTSNICSTSANAPATAALSATGIDLACVPGDYFEVNVFVNDASVDILAAGSQFWIEAI